MKIAAKKIVVPDRDSQTEICPRDDGAMDLIHTGEELVYICRECAYRKVALEIGGKEARQ